MRPWGSNVYEGNQKGKEAVDVFHSRALQYFISDDVAFPQTRRNLEVPVSLSLRMLLMMNFGL